MRGIDYTYLGRKQQPRKRGDYNRLRFCRVWWHQGGSWGYGSGQSSIPEALFAGRSLGELAGEEFNDTVLARENLLVRMKAVAKDSEATMAEEMLAEELRLEIEYPRG